MIACQNCGEKIEESTKVCPHCGEYIRENDDRTDSNGLLRDTSPEEEFLNGPGDLNEAVDNLPDDTYSDDELEKRELEAERRKFGKSTE